MIVLIDKLHDFNEEICFSNNVSLTKDIELIESVQEEIKCLLNVYFEKKSTKVKKTTILFFLTTFHNFDLNPLMYNVPKWSDKL